MEFAINGVTFSLVELIVWCIVGAICAGIAQAIVGYHAGGLLLSIIIGIVGAMVGSWIARELGLPAILTFSFRDVQVHLVWAILGSALLVLLLSAIQRPYYRRRRYAR